MLTGRSSTVRRVGRTLLFYVLLGVLLTYVSAAVAAAFLPGWVSARAGKNTIHRGDFAQRPYLRLRTWHRPYGDCFQIHRTGARLIQLYAEWGVLSETQAAEIGRGGGVEAERLPRWSSLRGEWPHSLARIAELFEQKAYWYETRMGWPLPCLRSAYAVTSPANGPGEVLWRSGALTFVRPTAYTGRFSALEATAAIPLIPDWPRFGANVALYGLSVWALARSWRAVRRWRRRRLGRCPACSYDLRASPERCPECGAAA